MWAGQSLAFTAAQRFLTSGGMGSMGFALPAAVGACLAAGRRPVVLVAGDGGFQLNIQELQTVKRNALPLKLVVLNNRAHGMVRQFQESYFESRYQSTVVGYDAPEFARVAEAYGIPARRLDGTAPAGGPERDRAVAEALAWLWRDPGAPALLEVVIPTGTNVYPKLAFGRPITEMEPDAKPVDMEGT
jgi:acetolactate synthase-1/2/3 large subunit